MQKSEAVFPSLMCSSNGLVYLFKAESTVRNVRVFEVDGGDGQIVKVLLPLPLRDFYSLTTGSIPFFIVKKMYPE